MALVTFLSDFGDKDYYVPAVKAKILSINPQLNIIDISHSITHYSTEHGAFILGCTFRDFPKGTVHLFGINTLGLPHRGYIAAKLEEHIFVGPNDGFMSLLSECEPTLVVQLEEDINKKSTFPTRDILAVSCAKIASGAALEDLGNPLTTYHRAMAGHAKATREQIVGNVIRVDQYGNLITNIKKVVFDKLNSGKFNILFARESMNHLHSGYDQAGDAEPFAFFNSMDLLEIGLHNAHGGDLLGLKKGSVVYINFGS